MDLPHTSSLQSPPTAGRRAAAKQRTRQALLSTAKQLIVERGYEAATVRDIAAAAGLSTGAVFASFADKADLFNELITVEYEALLERMAAAKLDGASVRDDLTELIRIAYRFHLEALPLLQAIIAFSWLRMDVARRRRRSGVKPILAHVGAVLRAGVESGQLSPSLDIDLIAEMIWDSYLANYRHAIFEGWDLTALEARMALQIQVLLDGYQMAA